jgi:hypothetical protein
MTASIPTLDALIVRENVARYATSGKLDATYLTTLSAGAAPELVAALPAPDDQSRAEIGSASRSQKLRPPKAGRAGAWGGRAP